MTARRRLAVIGGGIAGLAAAYELAETLQGKCELLLLEASSRLGGKIETDLQAGLTMELGPDSFLSTKPWAAELCQELGLGDSLVGTHPQRRAVFILHRGRLERLPDGLIMMVPTRLAPLATTRLLSPPGKLRACLEPLLPRATRRRQESIESFISRRFGAELYQAIVEPMMSGIYAGDGGRLSVDATFPILREWERQYGSVALGALALKRKRTAAAGGDGPPSLFLAPRGGLQQLVAALEARLLRSQVSILTRMPVHAISNGPAGYLLTAGDDQRIPVDGVILATPAFDAARLLSDFAPALASSLDQIEYASTATVNLAYHDKELADSLDGYGYVIPAREGRPALACSWTSTKFPDRAPPGTALLRVFLGRYGQEHVIDQPDLVLIEVARQELSQTMGLNRKPDLVRLKRWRRAMPQYNLGHAELVKRIETQARSLPGIALAGAAYGGIGIPDCIRSGRQAARDLASHLG